MQVPDYLHHHPQHVLDALLLLERLLSDVTQHGGHAPGDPATPVRRRCRTRRRTAATSRAVRDACAQYVASFVPCRAALAWPVRVLLPGLRGHRLQLKVKEGKFRARTHGIEPAHRALLALGFRTQARPTSPHSAVQATPLHCGACLQPVRARP